MREVQGMALNSLSLAQLIEALPLAGENLSGLAKSVDRAIAHKPATSDGGYRAVAAGPALSPPTSAAGSGSHYWLDDYPWTGCTAVQGHKAVAPLHPSMAIQPPLSHEACCQSRGRVIDHGDQVQLLASPFGQR